MIQLPGLSAADQSKARKIVTQAAFLEFGLVHTNSVALIANGITPQGYKKFSKTRKDPQGNEYTDEVLVEIPNKYGLKAKTHVNQFNSLGGVKASVEQGALSVDHLEQMNKEDFEILLSTNCMPTILPSCSFFLGIPYSPARKMIDIGLPIALASDYNPGSSPSGNMNFVASLGCIKLKMTPEEVINAITINSAYAMGVENKLGSIAIGKKANLFITKPIPNYSYLPYRFGEGLIKKVFLNGELQ